VCLWESPIDLGAVSSGNRASPIYCRLLRSGKDEQAANAVCGECGFFRLLDSKYKRCTQRKGLFGARLTIAADLVFEARQLLDANRATGVHLSRRNPDLGAHPELATVGKLRRCIV